ncbi:hypothetical protein [Zooshikella sp. RANM57]|uniref:hypothetical protein n=1 Tax=Zooshikella sp. RANM57 TaxID=3425863 RepID=UPI003D6FCF62
MVKQWKMLPPVVRINDLTVELIYFCYKKVQHLTAYLPYTPVNTLTSAKGVL